MSATHTLILTQGFQPHRIVSWQEAVSLLWTGKIEVLEEYDEVVRSPSVELYVPAVGRLLKAVRNRKKAVKFSRINVMTRDNFVCQYCGTKLPMSKLNYDHVVPRSQGGKTVWENIVTCCYPCNNRKAGKTPEQAGMLLRSKPTQPKSLPLTPPRILTDDAPEQWKWYLGSSVQSRKVA